MWQSLEARDSSDLIYSIAFSRPECRSLILTSCPPANRMLGTYTWTSLILLRPSSLWRGNLTHYTCSRRWPTWEMFSGTRPKLLRSTFLGPRTFWKRRDVTTFHA